MRSNDFFDYVIIGGGAAGAVLAGRLSERPDFRVALIEAGPDLPPGEEPADILDAYPIIAYFNRAYHWQDLMVHLDDPRDSDAKPRRYEQAKVMGGGTSINGMFAFRGLPWDFDDWVRMGAAGWGWDDVLPYYRKLERDLDYDGVLHGSEGPLPIRRIGREQWPSFSNAAANTFEGLGFNDIEDHNGRFDDGYFPMSINNVDGKRVSSARAYLTADVRKRPNLAILARTRALALRFDGHRAIGVTVRDKRGEREIDAGETILCAGAMQSPPMLMRAGIGPADHLREHGIAVRADRPGVGANLQDHPMVAFAAVLKPGKRCPKAMRRHIHLGLRYSSGRLDCPPGDMFVLPSNRAAWHPLGRMLGSILVCVNKPFSTGLVGLNAADPEAPPFVNFRQLSDERDLVRLEDGMKLLWRALNAPAMAGVIGEIFPATFSDRVRRLGAVSAPNWLITLTGAGLMSLGPRAQRLLIEHVISPGANARGLMSSPNALRSWVIENACGSWHVSGSCRMGRDDDALAVVDPHARVMRVERLRVVDASIMPSVVSANTMLTTIMMAEKIADAIKDRAHEQVRGERVAPRHGAKGIAGTSAQILESSARSPSRRSD
jgi:5-(hydroxymethyl)furfural/furfural oxidase